MTYDAGHGVPGRSLAAVLFTDLVGSTALRAALGEERADELRGIHDTILGGYVQAHGGRVLKGTGDGLVAAFGSATDALTAAIEMQRALHRHNRQPGALAQLVVRMGLSVGDVSWDGGDCFGVPLVEAARLEARAEGGQILCTDYVRVMARGRGGHRFRPLGALELKGLPEPVEASEVEWEPEEVPESAQLPFPASLGARSALRFVGRERELGEADRLLKRDGGIAVLWVVGEPGIGKTRLATELARRRFAAGAHVLFGRCDEDLSAPYQPFVAALRDWIAAMPPARLRDGLGPHHLAELARLVPELAALAGGVGEAVQPDPETQRHRLFEAVRAWLRLAGGDGRPVVLVLDDLQWAAGSTSALLGHLLRSEPMPLAIVATLRSTEALDRPLAGLLDSPGDASARTITLRGLGEAGVGRLIEDATRRHTGGELASRPYTGDTSDLARRIHAETAGNPLFVAAMISGLERGGAGDGELPTDVRSAVRRRTSRLSEAAQGLLRAGALSGLEFDLRVVGRVLGLGIGDLLDVADEVTEAHLVEEVGPSRARFAHALVRAALQQEIRPSRAGHLHALIAEAIEAVHPDRLDEHAEALAHHYAEALHIGGPAAKALEYRLLAARRATAAFAHDSAAEHYRLAVGLLEVDGRAGTRAHGETLVAQGEAEFMASAFPEARATLRRAAGDAEVAGWADLLALAAVHFEHAVAWPGLAEDDAAELLDRAAARLGPQDSLLAARVLCGLGRALGRSARADEAPAVMRQAVELARRLGDEEALAEALLGFFMLNASRRENAPDAHRAISEAYEIARRHDLPYLEQHCMLGLGMMLLELGRIEDVRVLLDRSEVLRRQVPVAISDMQWSGMAGVLALSGGRLADAERLAGVTRDMGARAGLADPDGVFGVQMFGVRREQGRLAEVAPALGILARMGAAGGAWRPGLASLYTELGMVDEAGAELAALVVDGRVLIAEDARRPISLSYLADVACALDDAERAAVLYAELEPYAEMWISMTSVAGYGPAARFLGALATTTGEFGAAQAHFEDALDRCHAAESVTWTAHTQLGFARLLHRRGGPGDIAQAHLLARAARDTARRVGMAALERRAEALLAPAS